MSKMNRNKEKVVVITSAVLVDKDDIDKNTVFFDNRKVWKGGPYIYDQGGFDPVPYDKAPTLCKGRSADAVQLVTVNSSRDGVVSPQGRIGFTTEVRKVLGGLDLVRVNSTLSRLCYDYWNQNHQLNKRVENKRTEVKVLEAALKKRNSELRLIKSKWWFKLFTFGASVDNSLSQGD